MLKNRRDSFVFLRPQTVTDREHIVPHFEFGQFCLCSFVIRTKRAHAAAYGFVRPGILSLVGES